MVINVGSAAAVSPASLVGVYGATKVYIQEATTKNRLILPNKQTEVFLNNTFSIGSNNFLSYPIIFSSTGCYG